MECFNGRRRDERLSVRWLLDLDDACVRIEAWRMDYAKVTS